MTQNAISGLAGGDNGQYSAETGGGTPSVIFEGRCYQTVSRVINGVTANVLESYDLRTGKVYWDNIADATNPPTVIEYDHTASPAVEGGGSDTGMTPSLVSLSNNMLIKYNPFSGAATLNMTLPTFSSIVNNATGTTLVNQYYMNGYVIGVQIVNPATYTYRLINWTTFGSSTNFASRIVGNISFPFNSLGQFQDFTAGTAFIIREPDALDTSGISPVGAFPFVNLNYDNGTGIRHGMRIVAASLVTGKLLFNTTMDDEPITADQAPFAQPCNIADHGELAVLTRHGFFDVFNENTGALMFKTQTMSYPWDLDSFGAYAIQSAYGMFYREGYSGVYAFNWTNGNIVWKFEAPAPPWETPYTNENGSQVYSWYSGGEVADGMLFSWNTEHTATQPISRGWSIYAINAMTGQGVWNMTGAMTPGAVADGYLTASNAYDGYTYCFGAGQSKTTVSAPQTSIQSGQGIVLTGNVLDQSPAQSGVAAVSDDSMANYMEYLHQGAPIGGLYNNATITGVPVSLDAIDPNNNAIHIATVTTDGTTGTFGYTWTPTIPGQYKVTATFAGDDSYGSSWATTYATLSQASSATSTPPATQAQAADYTMTIIATGIAIIIAVAIAAALIILLLRKRQ